MITTITLNPAIDRMIEVTDFETGKVHRVQKVVKSLGGKSINVARILSGLEIETQALCFVGDMNLEEVLRFAQNDKICMATIEVEGYTRTNVKLIEPDREYRTTDINEPGFFISKDKLEKMTELILKEAQRSDYVVLSGSLPSGVEPNYYKELAIKLASITKVVIDADGVVLLEGMKGSPYLIKPNIHELEAALSRELKDEQEIVEACEELIKKYAIQYILVSMGEKGSILVGNQIALKADIIPVKVVSTVGAGDSMLAGFIYGLEQFDEDEEKLMRSLACGVSSSSIAISSQDHKSFSKDELEKMCQEVMITSLY